MSKTVLHTADSRGHADHGWLNARHSFSFANYYQPDRMNFGVLRVLNDDIVAPSRGFGKHPHDNMEIITIPLSGDLRHADSMGNTEVIRAGDVQCMSAGTGVTHSEFNDSHHEEVRLLQIWLFPREQNVTPRYDQITLPQPDPNQRMQQILSPNPDDEGVWIHQDAWFHIVNFDAANQTENYTIRKTGNGVYAFLIEGEVTIEGQQLHKRDALGIQDIAAFDIVSNGPARLLLLDVPMTI